MSSICESQAIGIKLSEHVNTTHPSNFNLSKSHKELLWWYYCLGHIGLCIIQIILHTGALATSHAMQQLQKCTTIIPSHDMSKCAACQFGKQTNQTVPGKKTCIIEECAGILSAKKRQPGQRVFIDHFECSTRGRTFKGQGNSK